jgi:integrase/recombinase XerC
MLQKFKIYLEKEKRYSSHTVRAYVDDITQFFTTVDLDHNDIEQVKEVNPPLIRSFIVHSVKLKLDPKSISRKLSSCRSFYRYLMTQSLVEYNPFSNVKAPKASKRLPDFIQKQEITYEKTELLFTDDLLGRRDKLMFELLYQTGIRLSELINLRETDFSKLGIRVLGKRNKERIVALGQGLIDELEDFIKEKIEHGIHLAFLFFTDSSKKMYPKFVYRKINFYLSQLTTLNKRSPHIMRHTFATHMLNEGVGIEILKEILGHANLAATQVYTHNSFEQINSIYKSAHPRGHNT